MAFPILKRKGILDLDLDDRKRQKSVEQGDIVLQDTSRLSDTGTLKDLSDTVSTLQDTLTPPTNKKEAIECIKCKMGQSGHFRH
jgi:hypothetical protein